MEIDKCNQLAIMILDIVALLLSECVSFISLKKFKIELSNYCNTTVHLNAT
jgi:hypothetical protein